MFGRDFELAAYHEIVEACLVTTLYVHVDEKATSTGVHHLPTHTIWRWLQTIWLREFLDTGITTHDITLSFCYLRMLLRVHLC